MGAFLSTWSRLIWLFSLVFASSLSHADEYRYGVLDPFHPRTPLPSASIRAVSFDAQGFAWITIYSSGLARYTGDELTVYGVESGISSVAVRELAIDSKGFIWVGSDKGLSVSKVSANDLASSSEMSFLTRIGDVQLEQKNIVSGPVWHNETNRIYVLTAHELIGYEWPQEANSKIKVFRRSIEEFGIHSVKVAGNQTWFFADRKVIHSVDPFLSQFTSNVMTTPCTKVSAFFRGQQSDWAGCKSGELWYRTTKGSEGWKLLANYDEVYSLESYEDKVLAATRTGVVILDEAGEIQRFDADTGLDTSQLKSVVRSPNGGLWFGGTNGLASLTPDYRRLVSISSWRESESLVRMIEDNLFLRETRMFPGHFLLGGTDLIWVERETSKPSMLFELPSGERAWVACEDAGGESLWVSTTSQLLQFSKTATSFLDNHSVPSMRFNGEEYRITSTAFGRGNGCTSYQTETSEGVCFSEPEQILCVDSKSGIRRFDSAAGLPKNSSQAISVGPQGHLWVGSFSSGLFKSTEPVSRLSNPRESLKFSASSDYDLVTTNVESIMWADGKLLLATDQGLVVYEAGEEQPIMHLHEENGLGDTYIYTMALDDDSVWVGGNRGARKVRLKDGAILRVLDRGSGLLDQEMPWHQAVAVLEDGRVGLATNIGFYFYDETYSRKSRRIDNYPLRFRSVEVDYSRFREQNEVRFSYGIGPVDGFEDVWYRYRVNGAGGNWSDPSLGTRSILQNLPAFGVDSTFYLEVQASFDRDVWSQALVRYPVTIAPAFWFTWWGLSISAGLLLAFMGLTLRVRLKSERRRSNELRQLAEALHEANSEKERELLERRSIEGELSSIKEKASSLSRELRLTEGARNRAAESLETVERSLIQAEKLASMGQMIAGVTHELVNPAASLRQSLSPVKSHLDQVLLTLNHLFDNSEPEAITVKKGLEKELAAVVQAVSYSDQISERILEYSTALRNHARYDDEEAVSFDLQAAIEESNLLLRNRLKDVDFSVHFETAVELEGWLGQMVQVFTNLYINALDACASHGVAARLRTSCRPAIRDGRQGVELHVDDNGSGIETGDQGQIFEPLFTTKPRGEGTGLGLSTVRQVIKRHEGEIDVSNQSVLGGARFVIWLPLKLTKPLPG